MADDYSDLKSIPGEELYVAFDDEYGYGVFGEESGFCYFLGSEEDAYDYVENK